MILNCSLLNVLQYHARVLNKKMLRQRNIGRVDDFIIDGITIEDVDKPLKVAKSQPETISCWKELTCVLLIILGNLQLNQ